MEGRISRRELLKYGSGTAVVSAVGISGLLSLLANREAFAQGGVIAIVGVTTEVGDRDPSTPGSAHRHTFDARFFVRSINRSTGEIIGDLMGRTNLTFETGSEDVANHVHEIRVRNIRIGDNVSTLLAAFHSHQLNVD